MSNSKLTPNQIKRLQDLIELQSKLDIETDLNKMITNLQHSQCDV